MPWVRLGACWRPGAAVMATGLGRQQPPGRPGGNQLRRQLPICARCQLAGWPGRRGSPAMASYSLRRACWMLASMSSGRWGRPWPAAVGSAGELGEPCAGLVGDRAGLVALGAVEAIIRVGLRGVGHGDHPGSRSGWAARPAPRSEGNFQASAWARCTLCLLPGRVNPASDVTSRWISPGIYGERGSAVAAGRLVSEADGD